jgi:type IV pilus assembly protein PilM
MKTNLGIDIGTSQIKFVEAGMNGKTVHVEKAYMMPAVTKALFSESQADYEELARTIKTGLKDSGITLRKAYVSLLESQVFTRIIEMPLLSDKELIQALRWEAERYIPLPLEEVNMDYAILARYPDKKKMELLLVASPIHTIEKYLKIFELAGVSVESLENEAIPLSRIYQSPNANFGIVDIGEATSNIFLTKRDMLSLSRPIGLGGATFTKSLMTELNLPTPQAEEYKKTYGLSPDQLEGRMFSIMSPLVDTLIGELNQSLIYFKERYPEEVVTKIILTGGSSLMAGLPQYMQDKLQIEVVVGSPWTTATFGKTVKDMQNLAPFFSVATGLAMRETK